MPAPGAARRYAQAVFALAQEKGGEEEAWRHSLHDLAEIFSTPDLAAFLRSPRIPLTEKRLLLEPHLAHLPPPVQKLAFILTRRGYVDLPPALARAYEEMVDAHRGIVWASVTTAVALDPDEEARVRALLQLQATGRQVRAEFRVDPGILGGLVVRLGDKLVDGSARTRLRQLREKLRTSALLEV